jgi:hypothetical protein
MSPRTLAVLATFLSFPVLLLADATAQRDPDRRINTNPAGGAVCNRPRVATAGDRAYVVWQDTRSGFSDIYATRSLDRGGTWLASDRRLDLAGSMGQSIAPEICASGDVVHVVWEEHRASPQIGDVFYNRSLDGGATWLAADVRLDLGVAAGAGDAVFPQVVCDGNAVHVVWADGRSGFDDVYYNRSLDGGTTWLAADVRLDTGDAAGAFVSTDPRLVCRGSNVHVVWTDNRNGHDDIFCNRSGDGGATWLAAAQRVDHAPGNAFASAPQLACSTTHVHVLWADDRDGLKDVYHSRCALGGTAWQALDTRLDATDPPGGSDSIQPQLACDGNAVYTVWEDYRTFANPQVFFSRSTDGGVTWAPDALLNPATTNCFSFKPAIACDGARVAVVWESQACGGNGASDVWCRRSLDLGATWLPAEVRLDRDLPGTRASVQAQVALDGDRAYVVWSDHRHSTQGRCDIYFNVPYGMLPYGPALAGTGGIAPRLTGNGAPSPGFTITLDATDVLGGTVGLLALGGPGSQTAVPLLGGTLLVVPAVTLTLLVSGPAGVAGAGASSFTLPLPSSTALLGWNGNFQSAFLDPVAPQGLSLSNAVELWIG